MARADYVGRGHRVSFWRTTYGVEVDFVWESPVKMCQSRSSGRAAAAGRRATLETFLDDSPPRPSWPARLPMPPTPAADRPCHGDPLGRALARLP